MKVLKSHKCFEGLVQFWEHDSVETKTKMNFSTFTPPGEVKGCLIWLSGLTCTDENFISKAGAQKYLAEKGLMVICPDTSPRGLNLPQEHDGWDFGSGAGFYVDATTPGYKDHYRMYSYVAKELYGLVQNHFKMTRISIFGHSMGGHGALVIGLKESGKFKSISAFAPIVNPMECPWGTKAFNGYLGSETSAWSAYDTCELIKAGHRHPQALWVDQGTEDSFLATQLLTDNLIAVCKTHDQKAEIRYQKGYDHSYYFMASYIQEHIEFHAKALNS
ncbi:S-formylglutathione hydrolase YeiG [compost metagenome]